MADKDFKVKTGLSLPQPLPVSQGGTGQTSTTNTLNSLLPTQIDNASKILSTDGTNTTWIDAPRGIRSGNTASRPASPTTGDLYYNTETLGLEVYDSGWWIPNTKPAIPTSLVATNQGTGRAYNNGQASIVFSPGTNSGKVSTYTVYSNPGGFTNTGSSSPIIITGLQSGVSYQFYAYAEGAFGSSSDSLGSSAITATTIPQAPQSLSASGADSAIQISFSGSNGGSSITNYSYSTDGTNFTAFSPAQTSSPVTISGLTNNQSYTFYLKATNANGTSLSSASVTASPGVKATVTGGTLTSDSTYYYRTFTSTSNLTIGAASLTADILVVAGGASGGSGSSGGWETGGGGGAGGLIGFTAQSLSPATYSCQIGGGGSAVSNAQGNNGTNSQFGSLTAAVGGGGGSGYGAGSNGGSGGGGPGYSRSPGGTGVVGPPRQGYDGGKCITVYPPIHAAGGGGGAGAVGGDNSGTTGGNGGAGSSAYSSWGLVTTTGQNVSGTVFYAGGGAGSRAYGGGSSGAGGNGGGSSGNGTSNTGGGGGGGAQAATSGAGGSGIIIVRYLKTAVA